MTAQRTGSATASATRSTTYAIDQEAYLTFREFGANTTQQGLLLKSASSDVNNTNNGRWIQVSYDQVASSVVVRTKSTGQSIRRCPFRGAAGHVLERHVRAGRQTRCPGASRRDHPGLQAAGQR